MRFELKDEEGKLQGHEEMIHEIFKLRKDAKALREKAGEMDEEAATYFHSLRSLTQVDKLESSMGNIVYVTRESSSFDKNGMKDYLIKNGVDSDLVKKAFAKATTTRTVASVNYYPPKEG